MAIGGSGIVSCSKGAYLGFLELMLFLVVLFLAVVERLLVVTRLVLVAIKGGRKC